MSYLIPAWELSKDTKSQYRQRAIEVAIQRALVKGLASRREELIWRGIFTSDLGLRKWIMPRHHIGKICTWIKHETPSDCITVISTVSIVTPLDLAVNELKFHFGAAASVTKAVFSLSRLYAMAPFLKALAENEIEAKRFEKFENWPIMEGYFAEPIIYDPSDWITIKLCCDSADRVALVLGGFIIEPIGKTTI